jgi:hypothetical protein
MEGGSPSCCAAARGSTIRTTLAPPSGTATTRTMSTPTLASVPAVSPPQHPSPSEPLEGIPAGVQEGSRPAPVIGDNRRYGLPLTHDRTIRTAPAHCPMAPDLGDTVGLCCAHTHHSDPAPCRRGLARAGLRQPWRGCGGEGIAGGGARQTRGWIGLLLLPPQGVLLTGELLAETRGSRCRSAVASSPRCVA